MDLYTRCPECQTAFRVTTQQLQASAGRVRCGECQNVFDAFASLTVQQPETSLEQLPEPELVDRKAEASAAAVASRVANEPPPAAPVPVGHEDSSNFPRQDPAQGLYEWEFKMPEPPRHTGLWSCAAALFLVALATQAAYIFRSDVMVSLPQTGDYYARACAMLGCSVGLPKLSKYLHIEASDLNAIDPAQPGQIQLLLSVRNRAPVELAYPSFELTLTDAGEQAVARKVFMPADYLQSGTSPGGIRAGGELSLQLYLDTGNVRAAGYRVYLFYQ